MVACDQGCLLLPEEGQLNRGYVKNLNEGDVGTEG